jgi:hypothetical protein
VIRLAFGACISGQLDDAGAGLLPKKCDTKKDYYCDCARYFAIVSQRVV